MTKPRRSQLTSHPAAPQPASEPQQTPPSETKPTAQEPPSTSRGGQGRKKNASVYLTPSDHQRVTLAIQLYGRREGYRDLSDLGARLIMAEVERIEAAYNGGRRLDDHNPLDHI